MLAQMTLEALVRLGQEVGSADEVSQTHVHGCLVVEQAGCEQEFAGVDESMTALLQLTQSPLQRFLISDVIADPGGDCRELRHDLRWGIVRQRHLGRAPMVCSLTSAMGGRIASAGAGWIGGTESCRDAYSVAGSASGSCRDR